MNGAARREAAADYSKDRRGRPSLAALRGGLALAGLAGALALIATTATTVIEIKVITTSDIVGQDTHLTGADRHGPALAILGIFAVVMLFGALRGARPAMFAVAAAGAAALGLALVRDLPDLDETGEVGILYDQASASAAAGWYLETAGGVLLVLCGVGLALLSGGGGARRDGGRRSGGDSGEEHSRLGSEAGGAVGDDAF